MQRVLIRKPGGYKRLEVITEQDPTPRLGHVTVRTQSIGVNYADCLVRMGLYSSAKHYVGWPITPGFEFSGVIDGIGEGVEGWQCGDHVFGVSRFGAYSTHLAVPAAQIRRVFPGMTMEQAGAFPVTHLTAWYALTECAHLRNGSRVLVHSAAGGVGSALVGIAKSRGATVIAVVGASHKVADVTRLGADCVIDKGSESLWDRAKREAPSGFDLVLDANGAQTYAQSFRSLAPGGRLVVYGAHGLIRQTSSGRPSTTSLLWNFLRLPKFRPLSLITHNKGVVGFNLSYLFDRLDLFEVAMQELADLLVSGRLRLPPLQTFEFSRVADAQRALESGQTVGKLILVPPARDS